MRTCLPLPALAARTVTAHAQHHSILTYQNDGKDEHCLISWNPDGTNGTFAAADTPALCSGVPHGLKITTEGEEQFLYHANNAQKLAKTRLDGSVVWIKDGFATPTRLLAPTAGSLLTAPSRSPQPVWTGHELWPQHVPKQLVQVPRRSSAVHSHGVPAPSCRTCPFPAEPQSPLSRRPLQWFATPPDSKYMYLCDGYGSDRVFAFESATGRYTNRSWGGRSPLGLHPGVAGAAAAPHGKFMENHGCTHDPRPTTAANTIVVSDRRNMRFEFFHYDPASPDKFEYYKTVDMAPSLGPGTLPCNMRMTHGSKFRPEHQGLAAFALALCLCGTLSTSLQVAPSFRISTGLLQSSMRSTTCSLSSTSRCCLPPSSTSTHTMPSSSRMATLLLARGPLAASREILHATVRCCNLLQLTHYHHCR